MPPKMDEIQRKLALIDDRLAGGALRRRLVSAAPLFSPAASLMAGIPTPRHGSVTHPGRLSFRQPATSMHFCLPHPASASLSLALKYSVMIPMPFVQLEE